MKRKIMITVIFAVFVSAFMMLTTLSGCTGKKTSSESAASSEVVSSAGRQDGERFEEVIQLEGMLSQSTASPPAAARVNTLSS